VVVSASSPITTKSQEGTVRSNSVLAVWGDRFERLRVAPLSMAAIAALCLLSGLWLLRLHAQRIDPQAYRAPAAVLLILLGAAQLRCVRHAWGSRSVPLRRCQRLLFLKWIFAGAVLCYVAGLVLGPDPSIGYLFCAAVAGWYTIGLWLLIDKPALLTHMSQDHARRMLGRTNHAAFAGICAVVAAESIVRLYSLVAGDPLPETYVAKLHALPPGQEFRGRQVNTLGYWDKEFKPEPRPGIFRIAVLGDGVTLSGTPETNCLAQIERRVPGVEIYNFGIPQAGPREYSAQLAHDVARFRPDLVLTFFSVGDDLTEELPLPGWFDWRGLRMYQLGARSSSLGERSTAAEQPLECSREAYLRRCASHLAVCRTPIDEAMSDRWQETTSYLAQMAHFCRRQQTPLALVVVPGPFQVNATLCDALRRQAGYEPGQVDLHLPQRRLAALAAEQGLPVVDLLPYFESSGAGLYERYQAHWNDEGNQLAADIVGRWIEQHFRTQIASARHAANP
jgi:hypothetical protein